MLPTMDFDELNDFLADSNRRARVGRSIARLTFVLTAGLVAFLVYASLLAQPQCMCPLLQSPPAAFGQPIGVIVLLVGFVGLTAGLFWMWRIVRADPAPDARSWRHLYRP